MLSTPGFFLLVFLFSLFFSCVYTSIMTIQSTDYKDDLQARFSRTLAQVDAQLGQFQYCNEFERKTGIPKSYAALGIAGLMVLMIFFDLAGQLLTNFISWVYPGMFYPALPTTIQNNRGSRIRMMLSI